jgi:hypothetical protein
VEHVIFTWAWSDQWDGSLQPGLWEENKGVFLLSEPPLACTRVTWASLWRGVLRVIGDKGPTSAGMEEHHRRLLGANLRKWIWRSRQRKHKKTRVTEELEHVETTYSTRRPINHSFFTSIPILSHGTTSWLAYSSRPAMLGLCVSSVKLQHLTV